MILFIKKFIIKPLLFFIFGILAGFFISSKYNPSKSLKNEITSNVKENSIIRGGGYKFINPLLECELGDYERTTQLVNLEQKLKTYIDQTQASGEASRIALYFRDLNNGPWIGINEDDNFKPASLLKVPVLFAYLKMAEEDPAILKHEILIPTDIELPDTAEGLEPLVIGEGYSTEELLSRMIINSDNQSLIVLTKLIDSRKLDKINHDLGLKVPTAGMAEDFVSVREYASLFRVLYNSSYLSRTMSEYALGMMSAAKFGDGLNGGVPQDINISHKFGLRIETNSDETKKEGIQLHDCGVIYAPKSPYILCVMTRGENYENLSKVIKQLSAITFQEFTSKN